MRIGPLVVEIQVESCLQHYYFCLSNPMRDTAIVLGNLWMKADNMIVTYNIEFMRYMSQLG